MMAGILMLPLLLAGAQPPADVLTVSAELTAGELKIGPTYEIVVRVAIADGWSASKAGVPAPLLQIDIPPSVKLSGRVLTKYKELSRNEFLQAPFERLLKGKEHRIEFKLTQEPGPDEQIGLNIMTYVAQDPRKDSFFVRRRLVVPVAAGAKGVEAAPTDSSWGIDRDLLQIGDVASDFSLPKAFDPPIGLSSYLGQKNIIVTTYRAHW